VKKSFLLFLVTLNCVSIYASFPIAENINNFQSILPLTSDINTGEKILWFLLGITFYGIGVAIIYQLITKKKGPIKFSIIGFLAFILFIVLLILGIESGIDSPFVFG
jgi:hypothetical protein